MIKVGGYIYDLNEKGEWVFKAKDSDPVDVKGALKPKYKDLPRYKLIYDIEKDMNRQMGKQISLFSKDLSKFLKKTENG